ncbi:UbiA family prenyltransferase [Nonomuraea roseoviolacea]|uniref:4-hydroxybenzoate polyprenyltransferase n=1 Tax=Nonomuraea roseoviolacea subsp. carminata TaxID=160689 RepID=A0ABT1K4K9_9ACTN|nr:UbiA family prenyltransferase [Nonomuraea roseoviolacea]MCP2348947.1 4-hydroxybenzoate polyprenyltransferase [Nonomuraea roseoviolacea subsp. carminata]
MPLLCVAEARPGVLAVSALRYLAGVALVLPAVPGPDPLTVLRGGLAWVLSIFAVYLFNGVTDVAEDRINGSGRPIARGELAPRTAGVVAAVAGAASLAVTAGLPRAMVWIIAANLVLGFLYSGPPWPLKDSCGGTVVVLCLSGLLSYLAGAVVAGSATVGLAAGSATAQLVAGAVAVGPATVQLVVFAGAATCWMVLVGMPAKDLSDIPGDTAAGRRTLGVLLGERRARQVMVAAALGVLVVFGLAVALLRVPLTAVLAVMAAGVVAVMLAGRMTGTEAGTDTGSEAASGAGTLAAGKRTGSAGRGVRRRPYRAFMLTQHLLHITPLLTNIWP